MMALLKTASILRKILSLNLQCRPPVITGGNILVNNNWGKKERKASIEHKLGASLEYTLEFLRFRQLTPFKEILSSLYIPVSLVHRV